jgi:hypothetical protein
MNRKREEKIQKIFIDNQQMSNQANVSQHLKNSFSLTFLFAETN